MKTIIILISLLFGFISSNNNDKGSITGKVTDTATGQPVKSVTVTIYKDGNFVKSGTTDDNGIYLIKDIVPGTYSLEATHFAYKKIDKNAVIITANTTTKFDLKMEPNGAKLEEIIPVLEEDAIEKEVYINQSYNRREAAKCVSSDYFTGGNVNYNNDTYTTIDWNTEEYDKINENIFKDVINNPLSTFSVDVDRAAYANVRRFLKNNQKPYKDAVRIEEMINYFDYNYPQPKGEDPFSINLELGNCPWNQEHQLLHIGLKGQNIENDKIPANNLVFLIDVSGSMSDQNKLPLLKQAFKILVEKLRPEDHVAIVVYAGAAGEVLPSTPGNEKNKIIAALDMLQSGGSTAGGAGIKLAYKIAKQNYIAGGNNRVILATDGDFNVGASSDAEMVRLIEEKRDEGVFLTILGFGMGNYKDSKMEKISNAGNGNYAYIDNILEAKKIFEKELWGTLYTIAKDVKFQIEFNPKYVKAYRLIGYENRILNKEDFNDDKKDAGEIGCGHTVTALYEIIPAKSTEQVSNVDELEYQTIKSTNSNNMLTVKLRYKKPDEDTSKLIVNRYKKSDIFKENPSDNFKFSAAVAEFGMLLRDSEYKKDSSFEQVLALAKAAKGTDEYGYRQEFIQLVETADLLFK
ncbi:MAG: VWA domain-containing protein [Marinilabiliales bacterium]